MSKRKYCYGCKFADKEMVTCKAGIKQKYDITLLKRYRAEPENYNNCKIIIDFFNNLNIIPNDNEIAQIVNDNFWDLIKN